MEDTQLDIGVEYMLFMGNVFQRDCISADVEPVIGVYGEDAAYSISTNAIDKHIGQMTGHGIGRVSPMFDGTQQDRDQLDLMLNTNLADQITFQAKYNIKGYRWKTDENPSFKDEVLPEDLGFLRENILKRENASTQDG